MKPEARSFVSAKSSDPHRQHGPPVKPPRVGHPVRGSRIGKCVGWASPPLFLLGGNRVYESCALSLVISDVRHIGSDNYAVLPDRHDVTLSAPKRTYYDPAA